MKWFIWSVHAVLLFVVPLGCYVHSWTYFIVFLFPTVFGIFSKWNIRKNMDDAHHLPRICCCSSYNCWISTFFGIFLQGLKHLISMGIYSILYPNIDSQQFCVIEMIGRELSRDVICDNEIFWSLLFFLGYLGNFHEYYM